MKTKFMKALKLIALILILNSFYTYSQKYRMYIRDLSFTVYYEDKRCGSAYYKIRAEDKDGNRISNEIYKATDYTSLPLADYQLNIDGLPARIFIQTRAKDARDQWPAKPSCSKGTLIEPIHYIKGIRKNCMSGDYFSHDQNGGDKEVWTKLGFDYDIIPVVTLQEPGASNNLVGYDDPFTVKTEAASSLYDASVYKWQYQVADANGLIKADGWKDIDAKLNTDGKPGIELLPSSFLPFSAINKKVFFRINMCDDYISENIIYYELRASAPDIKNIQPSKPLCFGSRDGSITITLGRELWPKESISFLVEDLSKPIHSANGVTGYEVVESYANKTQNDFSKDPKTGLKTIINLAGLSSGSKAGYRLRMLAGNKEGMFFTDGKNHEPKFNIGSYAPVDFISQTSDVWCYNGYDGEINITASGGVPAENNRAFYTFSLKIIKGDFSAINKQQFTNKTRHKVDGLPKGVYTIEVFDSHGCQAKEGGGLGAPVIKQHTINQPKAPLSVIETYRKEPTANGWQDGKLTYKITGGTPLPDGSYETHLYESTANGTDMTVKTGQVNTNPQEYYITFHNLEATDYYLTVKDANWNSASDKVEDSSTGKGSCAYISQHTSIEEPDKIEAALEMLHHIHCNNTNAYNSGEDKNRNGIIDEYETGKIEATVSGGTPLPGNLPYRYIWEHKDPETGTWQHVQQEGISLPTAQINTLTWGDYRLNVVDANNVMMGEYEKVPDTKGINNYVLKEQHYQQLTLPRPPMLSVDLEVNDATCSGGTNGALTARVRGGIPFDDGSFNYEWSTGDSNVNKLINQPSGKYFVFIKDKEGCRAQTMASIQMPDNITIDATLLKHPTCYEGSDGAIEVQASGGVAPYYYEWSNGTVGNKVDNLTKGHYVLAISDAAGCSGVMAFELKHPEQMVLNIPDTIALCSGQNYIPDITIADPYAIYQWILNDTVESYEPTPELSKAGHYTTKIINAKGCDITKELVIKRYEQEINPQFMVSSQVFENEEIVVLDISEPRPEQINWQIPEEAGVILNEDYKLVLKIEKEGFYPLVLEAFTGECKASYTSNIIVNKAQRLLDSGDAEEPFIIDFSVSPNPSAGGNFTIQVDLQEESQSVVSIYSLGQQKIAQIKKNGLKQYTIPYTLNIAGVYIVLLETAKGSEVRKLIVN